MGSLTIIGMGLGTVDDLSIRAVKSIHAADIVYLESYTSYFPQSVQSISEQLGVRVIPLGRYEIEQEDVVLERAQQNHVAFLVIGDALSATTHAELLMRAHEKLIPVTLIHNVSILTAVSATGLEQYKFGRTASLVYPRTNWWPKTAYQLIEQNRRIGAHSLILLDIVTTDKEIALLDYTKGNIATDHSYNPSSTLRTLNDEPIMMMSPNEALGLLLAIETEERKDIISEESMFIVCSRMGSSEQKIRYATLRELRIMQHGAGPHSLILPAELHFVEEAFCERYRTQKP